MSLFEEAFDELHRAVTEQIGKSTVRLRSHYDYPIMSSLDSGFPTFREAGALDPDSPKDYVGTVSPRGLLALFDGAQPKIALPKITELASFLHTHVIGTALDLEKWVYKGKVSELPVETLVRDAVERYIHLHGLGPIDSKLRFRVIWPLISGSFGGTLQLRLVVPIAVTHFEFDYFRLSERSYIARIPKRLQLARARMSTRGSGAEEMVVGAATHAFISKDWSVNDIDKIEEVGSALNQISSNAVDEADSFFGALRIATGVNTGYAQTLWVPQGWALQYFCDLPPVYGTTLRRYPSAFDNWAWRYAGDTITREQLIDVRRIYGAVVGSQQERIRLAIRRLNGCLTRDDAADSILDGTIGLELLLGDDDNQSLSYKLRLRAAALAVLQEDPLYPPAEIASKVKQLYKARSAIVHGLRKKASHKATEPSDKSNEAERMLAADLLRFVLKVLLDHPQYLEPSKIDEGLLLRADQIAKQSVDGG
ncbi:HEPN domain-containing protein [Bradyrhizobium sp.]|uniref:HEPN domain-containing protein n=1 Tax=Bradyrhizobium sp. TaxID=376 RepID=UPI002735953D|nr:HEPN domain-containing protein [Bradyrhizobium sp.]MDP3692630.1 HEPN domain-containing protein [Bradyrhizobium sp.]